MKSFEHVDVTTVDEALRALQFYHGQAVLIAGGTDLLGILKDRILPDYPQTLINIKTISELEYIRDDSEGLKIGALARLADIAESPKVSVSYPGLAQAAISVATPEIRNMGTLGGNLCQSVRCWYYRYPHSIGGRIVCYRKGGRSCPALKGDNRYHAIMGSRRCVAVCPSDLAVVLTALDATVTVSGPKGKKTIGIQDFFDPLGNVRYPDEVLTEIQIPQPSKQSTQSYLKYRLREPIDFAIVSVASVVTLEDHVCTHVRIVLGGVAPTPVRATKAEEVIKGQAIDTLTVGRAAEAAVQRAKPLAKNGYKVEIAKTLIKRTFLSQGL